MNTPDAPARRPSPIANAVDIVVAPNAAFDRLREVPTWVWAFVIASVLCAIGWLLLAPAMIHAMETSAPAKLAASPQLAKLPPEQQQSMIAMQIKFSRIFFQLLWLLAPIGVLFVGLIQAVILLIGNAVGHGDGTFKKYFALSVTVSVIGTGLATLALGIIVTIRGASTFEDQNAVTSSLPSLALLAPGAHGALAGFLGAFSVFTLWAAGLLAFGMVRVGRISPPIAWTVSILMLLVGASFAAYGAKLNG